MPFRAPIGGTDDFRQIRRNRLEYVDKSRFIGELLEDGALVVLLPRPRRFGKSTNLSMLRYYFERPPAGEDRADLFEDLAIWGSDAARVHFARYPVISITLKEVKPAHWAEYQGALRELVAECVGEGQDATMNDSVS